ncbi:MAG: carbohydrate porin [Verrucomicrobia bacterium]|nr:carbohydrate porin [Verrucomicrobiota bacterium]
MGIFSFLCVLCGCYSPALIAQAFTPPKGVHFLSDWEEPQKQLADSGVDINGTYALELQANPIGGRNQGFANVSAFWFSCLVDLEKVACLWPGFGFYTTVSYRSGQNLSEIIGNEFNVATWFGGSTFYLDECYLQQKFPCCSTVFRAGRMAGELSFAFSPLMWNYVTLAIDGNPISLYFNTPFPPDPFACWGLYFETKPCKSLLVKGALYNSNFHNFNNSSHGLNWSFDNTNGTMVIGEIQYQHLKEEKEGNYRVGGYATWDRQFPFTHKSRGSSYGFYFVIDQCFYKKAQLQWSTWAFGLVTPIEGNVIPYTFGWGLVGQGLCKNQPNDTVNFGLAYGLFGSEVRRLQAEAKREGIVGPFGNLIQSYEGVVELNYWFWLNPSFAITPLVQWVINPGAARTLSDAFVVGLQLSATL